ncbi:MAG: sigma-70 family RNA polymerase sigma factor [Ruminococcaceae bacterium]|nr:sigma-70 family RNA polymerase sigma factor [Oscillospiraceae bacterium]
MFSLCLSSTYLKTDDGKNELDSLLSAIASGNKKALEQLYTLCSPAVYSFALSILRNEEDAKDVLQDSFVALYRQAEKYRPKGNPMAWILTITKNLCLMKLRQRKKDGDTPLEDLAFTLSAPEDSSPEDKIVIEAALNSLSSEERQIVILHAVAGLRHREIAKILDLALPTALSKYNRALKKLRKMLC